MKENTFYFSNLNTSKITVFSRTVILLLIVAMAACKKADVPILKPTGNSSNSNSNTAFLENLTEYKKYKANRSSPYDLVVIGDSYVQANYFTLKLDDKFLAGGATDGGPGYCSFGRWDDTDLRSIDGSIDDSQLTFTYDPLKWNFNQVDAIGPCGDVKSNVDNANITVSASVALKSLTIIYEKHSGAGSFRYRVNGGAWTTVSAEGTTSDIGNVVVNTSSAGADITLEIESLKAGQRFCGVVGRNSRSNAFTTHKAGMSGGIAVFFAQNDQWLNSVKVLAPKGVAIMFGTNEMEGNLTPDNLRENVQLIISRVRQINPDADVLLLCPPQTKFENEEPKKYKIADYAKVLRALAEENKAGFINFSTIFPPFSQASVDQGYMDDDRKHPGIKGGELIAQTIYDAFTK